MTFKPQAQEAVPAMWLCPNGHETSELYYLDDHLKRKQGKYFGGVFSCGIGCKDSFGCDLILNRDYTIDEIIEDLMPEYGIPPMPRSFPFKAWQPRYLGNTKVK